MTISQTAFPRINIENVSVSRLIIGANWFKGFSHTSSAKDRLIRAYQTPQRIADTIKTFFTAGVDTLLIGSPDPLVINAIHTAEQMTGVKGIIIATPHFNVLPGGPPENDPETIFDQCAQFGAAFCFPHQAVTDRLVDPFTQTIRQYHIYAQMIRERGMIPGLSTHMPESVLIADTRNADVATYIQIYNAAGFLMQQEIEQVHQIIHHAKHPVITIKPMAAGRLTPLVGLSFVWNTIRPCDMVAVGTMNAEEAKEIIELSLSMVPKQNQIS